MKKWNILYGTLFFAACLVPSLGMISGDGERSSENRELAKLPEFIGEDGLNPEFLKEAGEYFQDHFAYRNQLVTANALVMGKGFGVSAADGVIQGTDGWLYYKDSLNDYQGVELMSGRSIFNVAHTLRLMQDYVEKNGCAFLFAAAPNKNTLYGEHMPYYDQVCTGKESNLDRLTEQLEAEGVSFVDLKSVFQQQEEVLYHKRDSHWNNRGASLAADAMLDALGKLHISYINGDYEVRKDFIGDLDKMLYPEALTPEEEIYYEKGFSWSYVEEVENNFAPRISTTGNLASGSLVMYRDSFGNALLPFLAEAYGKAYFSRGIPYQLTDLDACQADTVIVERAERFLPEMAENPPVMEGALAIVPETAQVLEGEELKNGTCSSQGMYTKLSGTIDSEKLEETSRIYVQNGMMAYEAFPVTNADGMEGFVLYVENGKLPVMEDGTGLADGVRFCISQN